MNNQQKKVGILTYHRGPNYGGFLQAWHLREALRSLGHEADVINYQNQVQADAEQPKFHGFGPRQLRGYFLSKWKRAPFEAPVNELSQGEYQTVAEKVDWESYDRVVVGSDVIWDFVNQDAGTDPAFYGALSCQEPVPFISYAASAGATRWDHGPVPDYVSRGLGRFGDLAVRDSNTAAMVARLLQIEKPTVVVDPTWLNEDPLPASPKKISKNSVVIYGIRTSDFRARVAREFCDKHGLVLVSAGTPCRWAHRQFYSLSPFQWVRVIADSMGLITSSLHGTHYGIKYQRPMAYVESQGSVFKTKDAVERSGRGPCSVKEEEAFTGDFLERTLLGDPITSGVPAEWKEESINWLRRAVS